MRLFKRIALGLLIVIAVFVAVSYLLPRHVIVERQVTIDAPPEAVFPFVNSLQSGTEWSPWTVRDPDMEVTFEGPEEGVGNTMVWRSDVDTVGNGDEPDRALGGADDGQAGRPRLRGRADEPSGYRGGGPGRHLTLTPDQGRQSSTSPSGQENSTSMRIVRVSPDSCPSSRDRSRQSSCR